MSQATAGPRGEARSRWTFLTNHGHVLVCIASDPNVRGREIAQLVGITERGAQAIIADLVEAGYLERTRVGRRNQYRIRPDRPLRHPLEQSHRIGELLSSVGRAPSKDAEADDGHLEGGRTEVEVKDRPRRRATSR